MYSSPRSSSVLASLYALFVALAPVLMMYKVPVVGVGVTTASVAIFAVYALLVVLQKHNKLNISLVLVISAYFAYAIIRSSSFQNVLICGVVPLHLFAIYLGALDAKLFWRVVSATSLVAAVCVVLQQGIHSVAGVHIPMIASQLCLEEMNQYLSAIATGVGIEGLYRPSAFFLEPAHLTQYCMVGLLFELFASKKRGVLKAAIISVGMIATTSGFAVAVVAGSWIAYALLGTNGKASFAGGVRILGVLFGLVAVFAIFSQTPFFQDIWGRVSGPVGYSSDSYNAIWGRTLNWDSYIASMEGIDAVIGFGSNTIPSDVYFTGVMSVLYQYGAVGLLLFYLMIARYLKYRCIPSRLLVLAIGSLEFLANLTGFISIIFLLGSVTLFVRYKAGTSPSIKEKRRFLGGFNG